MPTHALPRLATVLALALSLACASPSGPSPVLETETFTGTLAVQGTDSKTFVVKYTSDFSDAIVSVTGLNNAADATPLGVTIGLGFGTLSANGTCTRDPTFSSSAARLNQELVAGGVFFPGSFCVQIFDAGTLTAPATYTLTLKHF